MSAMHVHDMQSRRYSRKVRGSRDFLAAWGDEMLCEELLVLARNALKLNEDNFVIEFFKAPRWEISTPKLFDWLLIIDAEIKSAR